MTGKGLLMQPLAAVTPPRHMAHLVASRSYLSYDDLELQDKLKHNPYSYIQVINPDASRDVKVPRGTAAFLRKSVTVTRISRRAAGSRPHRNQSGTSTANRRPRVPGLGWCATSTSRCARAVD